MSVVLSALQLAFPKLIWFPRALRGKDCFIPAETETVPLQPMEPGACVLLFFLY